jgi:hypothetical protein
MQQHGSLRAGSSSHKYCPTTVIRSFPDTCGLSIQAKQTTASHSASKGRLKGTHNTLIPQERYRHALIGQLEVPAEGEPEELAALSEELAAADPGRARYPPRNRTYSTRYTFDMDGAVVMWCARTLLHLKRLPLLIQNSCVKPWTRRWHRCMAMARGICSLSLLAGISCLSLGFCLRRDAKVAVERYKARLVAKGFFQSLAWTVARSGLL